MSQPPHTPATSYADVAGYQNMAYQRHPKDRLVCPAWMHPYLNDTYRQDVPVSPKPTAPVTAPVPADLDAQTLWAGSVALLATGVALGILLALWTF